MKRDILNYLGNKIGELELPDGTEESVWQERLSFFSAAPVNKKPNVTPRQMRQALVLSEIDISTIEGAINALPEPQKTLANIEWEYAITFERDNVLVNQIAAVIEKTPEDVDMIWDLAASL